MEKKTTLSAWVLLLLTCNNQRNVQTGTWEDCAQDSVPDLHLCSCDLLNRACKCAACRGLRAEDQGNSATLADGSLLELNKMIKQVTGKSAIPNYSTYGCYCGIGGKGKPLDATDWCCRQHDCCYARVELWGCRPKYDMYHYTYLLGKVRCGLATWCEKETCKCDRSFVECLQKHVNSYRKAYRFFPNFWCDGQPPQC